MCVCGGKSGIWIEKNLNSKLQKTEQQYCDKLIKEFCRLQYNFIYKSKNLKQKDCDVKDFTVKASQFTYK